MHNTGQISLKHGARYHRIIALSGQSPLFGGIVLCELCNTIGGEVAQCQPANCVATLPSRGTVSITG